MACSGRDVEFVVTHTLKRSSSKFTIRSLLALVLVLGLSYVVWEFSDHFYYKPICERYAASKSYRYDGYTSGWARKGWPAECFFLDWNGNSKRTPVSTIAHTSEDWTRRILSWLMTIGGMGGTVLLASVVGGFKIKRKRR